MSDTEVNTDDDKVDATNTSTNDSDNTSMTNSPSKLSESTQLILTGASDILLSPFA